jgi:hypothetical protein
MKSSRINLRETELWDQKSSSKELSNDNGELVPLVRDSSQAVKEMWKNHDYHLLTVREN